MNLSIFGTVSVVKLDVFQPHGYRNLDEYSFVFTVYPEYRKNKECSYVRTEIVRDSRLLAMDKQILNAKKFVFKGGILQVNEFIEIIQEKTRFQTKYIAILKEQISRTDGYVGTKNLLLYVDNNDGEGLEESNYSAYYGRVFEASVSLQEAERQMDILHELWIDYRNNPNNNFGKQLKMEFDKKLDEVQRLYEIHLNLCSGSY
ncbi:hypothetical protein [Paenibacillus odorifer]|uniref:hypothetical protein n=1 Tax=Paenibacillus odorifer TaxID=189426 RepID=UPI0028A24BC6|nr:hypothetical protein [Paenibacillus odorifer]